MSILDRAKAIAQERIANQPAHDEAVKAKRARQDARAGTIYAELESLTGQTVKIGAGYAGIDVMRQYNEVVVCFVDYEPYNARDGSLRWRKGGHAKNKWSFTPVNERGVQVAWENGLQDYAELDAAIEDAARRVGAILCSPPWEETEGLAAVAGAKEE